MFKKLVVGALAAGIVLTGGIGAASANVDIPYNKCYNSSVSYNNGIYTKYVVQSSSTFSNSYTDKEGIKWNFKGYKEEYLEGCGKKYIAKYEGRK
ncbi:hypothetical protein [Bacillus sp. ME78]|uniref:hypothetical protein n=1 Tax=Bacillus sp. ME78 TaxID=2744261 RepID=UPI00160356D4|nr:hypothetical protein [Bacillus sp. ME78]